MNATHDRADEGIDHSEQIERMLDAYDRALTRATKLDGHILDLGTCRHLHRLMRQAIKQAWGAGHACAKQNNES